MGGWRRWEWLCWLLIGLCACAGNKADVWRESFDEAGAWLLSSDAAADVSLADGELVIEIFEADRIAWASTPQIYTNFKVQVDAKQVSGPDDNAYGVLVRMDKDDSFYAFSISGDGYVRAAYYTGSVWTVLGADWFLSEAVQQGAAQNHLAVEVQGPTYVFLVNDQEVLRVEHTARGKGSIGLYAGAFSEAGVIVAFDNLEVQPLP